MVLVLVLEFPGFGVIWDMAWRFGEYVLDPSRAELRGAEGPIHVERHTLDVLVHLIENAERVVTRDDLIDAVWGGRIVSDATISTAIKHARKAIGDSGAEQTYIKTLHRRGFRFVGDLTPLTHAKVVVAEKKIPEAAPNTAGAGRPSLAVLKFQCLDGAAQSLRIAEAFPAELISKLSRVRWLHMIARGSSFQFDPATATPGDVGAALGVRYIATGMVEDIGDAMSITVELLGVPDGGLIWTERFVCDQSEIQLKRTEIVSAIISALELAIPEHETRMSRHLSANEFDAWSHFHLGLSHLFRFNPGDNQTALGHFEASIAADKDFARAHAGLSFVHWQTAFMQFGDDRQAPLKKASDAAKEALRIDPTEPFAAFNLGRAHWLEGDLDAGLTWLDRSLQINPNSAQTTYCGGLIQVLRGASETGSAMSARALTLSPLDPMSYAMYAAQAIAAIQMEDFETARTLADQAVHTPQAHFYISMIAAAASELSGATQNAHRYRDRVLKEKPGANADFFFQAFPFQSGTHRKTLIDTFERLGLN